ncbi:RCC1/BLIP-II [Cubamyces sp. BRFM 1775]|nr:RCC1/BLIP-II [Cubamyces sp. BRFM 1775]
MPPRRSTRTTNAAENDTGASRTRSKRPATSPPPPAPAKRSRARQPQDVHVEVPIPSKPRTVRKARQEEQEPRAQSLHPPTQPAHERPCWQLFGWGNNLFCQLGTGEDGTMSSEPEFPKPTRNRLIEKLIAEGQFGEPGAGLETIAAGALHNLAISEDGAVWSFGINEHGGLGRPTQEDQDPTPGRIQSLVEEGFRAVRVVAGDGISAALSDRGVARTWGRYPEADGGFEAFSPDTPKQLTPTSIPDLPEERFASIAAGSDHLVLLTLAGEVYTVGCGDSGQLGYRVPHQNPVLGTIPHKVLRHSRGHRAVTVGAGSSTSFFVDEQGAVWGWGLNHCGQTGTGKLPAAPRPGHEHDRKKVRNTIVWAPQRVRRVSRAELGDEATVIQIAGGDEHTLFLTSDGRVFACGSGWAGQLGGGQQITEKVPEPVPVTFPHDVAEDPIVQVACGARVSAAVTRAGVLYTWGSNTSAQIGVVDAPAEVTTPTVIVRREGSWRAKVVSCGSQHCVALLQKKAQ